MPVQRGTRRFLAVDSELQKVFFADFEEATKQRCKVTRKNVSVPIDTSIETPDYESGRTNGYLDVNVIWKDYLIQAMKNIDGIDELVDVFLMHSFMQLDSVESKN